MFNGLLELSWIEMKVFMREPLGFIGSLVMPVVVYVTFGLALTAVTLALLVLAGRNFSR